MTSSRTWSARPGYPPAGGTTTPVSRATPSRRSRRHDRPLVARARRRSHPVRRLPPRVPAPRRATRVLLRTGPRGRRDGPDHIWEVVGLLHRPHREEAARALPPRNVRAVVRHRRLQPRLQVLPELGHVQGPRDGPADGPRAVSYTHLTLP